MLGRERYTVRLILAQECNVVWPKLFKAQSWTAWFRVQYKNKGKKYFFYRLYLELPFTLKFCCFADQIWGLISCRLKKLQIIQNIKLIIFILEVCCKLSMEPNLQNSQHFLTRRQIQCTVHRYASEKIYLHYSIFVSYNVYSSWCNCLSNK